MKHSVVAALVWGQVSLIGGLAVCFGLVPSYLRSEGGVSNYGTLRETVVFYTMAFGLAAYFTCLAAYRLHRQHWRYQKALAYNLYILTAMFVIVLLSTYPYKLNNVLGYVHELADIALFVFTLGLSGWLCLVVARSWWHILWLLALVIGAGISLITLFGLVHLLFIGQLVTALSFAVLLTSCVSHLMTSTKTLLEN
jgi:hypothetical protein